MAKCKEHDWQIVNGFSVTVAVAREYKCSKCGAAKYTLTQGSREEEISAALFNDYWKDYLNDR